jgi:predicted site-specific integrase-resolvase
MPARVTSPDEVKPDLLITPKEAQRRMAIGQTTYYGWVQKGWIKPIHFSKRLVRVRAAEVDDLINSISSGKEML